MVRLKVKYVMGINTFEDISIPYGAIKRNYLYKIDDSIAKFQFLMVRLKELCLYFAR